MKVPIRLVFEDWRHAGKSIYATLQDVGLSMGALHSGSTFPATIELDEDDAEILKAALSADTHPAFYAIAAKETT